MADGQPMGLLLAITQARVVSFGSPMGLLLAITGPVTVEPLPETTQRWRKQKVFITPYDLYGGQDAVRAYDRQRGTGKRRR